MTTDKTSVHKNKRTLWFIVGVAALSGLLSLSFLWLQLKHRAAHISGQIVSVHAEEIIIENKRGVQTTLIISESTLLNDVYGVLKPGLFIHSFGEWTGDRLFVSERIRTTKYIQ